MFDLNNDGWLEIISGPMFAGKSTELIRRLLILGHTPIPFILFKPVIDNRYARGEVVTHNKQSMPAVEVKSSEEIVDYITLHPQLRVIGIDEAQFFDVGLVKVVKELVFQQGKRVIIATLLLDYQDQPFGSVPQLLPYADEHTVLHAVCSFCSKNWANHTVRVEGGARQIEVGGAEKYKVACNECWRKMQTTS